MTGQTRLEIAAKSLLVAVFYGVCSLSMNFLNKAVLNSYNFNYPFFIMSCQMFVTLTSIHILRLSGVISVDKYNLEDGWQVLIPALQYRWISG